MRNFTLLSIVVLMLAVSACSASQTPENDAGIDAAATGTDAHTTPDAPRADALAADGASPDVGNDASQTSDAFVASDAGNDAFVAPDAFAARDGGSDAFVALDASVVCTAPFIPCNGACVNPDNDILHCGDCMTVCPGPHPYCNGGTCGQAPCGGIACPANEFCCDTQCCGAGELCCEVPGPISRPPQCTTPVGGTCPMGCPWCVCASPDTPIATPMGERAIADLGVGDLVYSADRRVLHAVPIVAIHQTPVFDHRVVRVELETGRVLEISPGHPTADGRFFGDLRAGDRLDGALVLSSELVPYVHAFTYDILPASDTGTYVAGGALVGSTLASPAAPVALGE